MKVIFSWAPTGEVCIYLGTDIEGRIWDILAQVNIVSHVTDRMVFYSLCPDIIFALGEFYSHGSELRGSYFLLGRDSGKHVRVESWI